MNTQKPAATPPNLMDNTVACIAWATLQSALRIIDQNGKVVQHGSPEHVDLLTSAVTLKHEGFLRNGSGPLFDFLRGFLSKNGY